VETATFDDFVDDLRFAISVADSISDSEAHSFKKLASAFDYPIPGQWIWDAYTELKAQGHLDAAASGRTSGDAHGRLSADGRLYLRSMQQDSDVDES
jgi:hypothetical protein